MKGEKVESQSETGQHFYLWDSRIPNPTGLQLVTQLRGTQPPGKQAIFILQQVTSEKATAVL